MLFEESLGQALIVWAPLAEGRVYGQRAPQNTPFPRIVYSCAPGERDDTQDGASGLCSTDVDLDFWDLTYGGAKYLAEQARLAINARQRSPQTPLVEGGPIVARIKLFADRDDDDGIGEAFVVTIPAIFRHYEET